MTGNYHTGSLISRYQREEGPVQHMPGLKHISSGTEGLGNAGSCRIGTLAGCIFGENYSSTGTEVWDYQTRGNTLLAEHLSCDVPRTFNSELLKNTRYSPGVAPY